MDALCRMWGEEALLLTTIAVNRECMWGDKQFTNLNTGNKWKGATKVYRFKAHPDTYAHCDFIIGFAGTAADMVTLANFFEYPDMHAKAPRVKGIMGLVLTEKKDIFMFDDYTKWLLMKEPFAAVGSGADYALGAMAAGKSPKEAVQIASKLDAFTGLGVKGYSFD
jgi:ATP-dependent protease HslVU (ClpYQ) peptidase subunit